MMKHHQIPVLTVFCLFISTHLVFAQSFLGLSTQGNGGFYASYQNPALLTANPHPIQLHLVSGGLHLDNNYVRYAAPFSMLQLLSGKNSRPLEPTDLVETRNGKPVQATLSAELRGPAVAFKVGDKTTVALMSRLRSGVQIADASPQLMSIVRLGLADADDLQELGYLALFANQTENRFNVSTMAYSEWGLSIGQVLSETDDMRFSGGISIKRYFGYAGGYMKNQSLSYRLLPDSTARNQVYMQVDQFDATVGYTDLEKSSFLSPGRLLGLNSNGQGWGFDIGVSYEVLGDEGEIAPLRLSASLTDIGSLRYKGPSVNNYTIEGENRQITEEEWRGYSSPRAGENQFNAFGRLFEEEFGLTDENNTGTFKMAPPTALTLSADMRLLPAIFINATLIQGIVRSGIPQWRQSSLLALTPRFETSKVGVAFPILIQNNALAFGTGLRLGPLRVGSDNLLGLFSKNGRIKAQGVDVYAGLSLGLEKKK